MQGYTKEKAIQFLRNPEERILDFKERRILLSEDAVKKLADHCGDCKTATCTEGAGSGPKLNILDARHTLWNRGSSCSLNNDIPGYERLAAKGDFAGAYRMDSLTNPMPEITGLACPDNLCQSGCMLTHTGYIANHILPVEAFLGEQRWKLNLVPPLSQLRREALNTRVRIIGTGPGGFVPAKHMALLGADVEMYDAADAPGGLVTRGLPGFKVENEKALRHYRWLSDGGVRFSLNTMVGRDISFADIANDADQIVIAMGAHKYNDIPDLRGSGRESVIQAIPHLANQNRRDDRNDQNAIEDGFHDVKGQEVVVVGAGDTAWDVVGTMLRRGASKITLAVRSQIRALDKEVKANREEAAAVARLRGVKLEDVLVERLGVEVAEVKGTPERSEAAVLKESGSDGRILETIKADRVILAIGSDAPDLKEIFEMSHLRQGPGGMLKAYPVLDPFKPAHMDGGRGGVGGGLVGIFKTADERLVPVFAVGDIVRNRNPYGPDHKRVPVPPREQALVLNALADGRNTVPDMVHTAANQDEVLKRFGHLALNF